MLGPDGKLPFDEKTLAEMYRAHEMTLSINNGVPVLR